MCEDMPPQIVRNCGDSVGDADLTPPRQNWIIVHIRHRTNDDFNVRFEWGWILQFTYYTEKSVAQALTALNERLQAKGARELDGWIDKNGEFSLSATTKIAGAFKRRTTLRGKIERVGGQTVVTGGVNDGVPSDGRFLVFVALALVGIMFLSGGNTTLALTVFPVGLILYILMKGDNDNSTVLVREVQRSLGAKPTPIKKTEAGAKAVRPVSAAKANAPRSGASKASTAKKTSTKSTAKKSTTRAAKTKTASKSRATTTSSKS